MAVDRNKPNWYIDVFPENSLEYKKLNDFTEKLNERTPKDYDYVVEDFYFDGGQNWMWTSILRIDNTRKNDVLGKVWALNPRQQEDILLGNNVETILEELTAAAEEDLQHKKEYGY